MDSQSITLTRRRLLAGVATAGVASAGAGAGTMALFSDTEESTGNTVSAGTLNLTLDGNDATVQFLSEVDLTPGDNGSSTVTLENTGSLAGYVDIDPSSLTDYENGCTGKENQVDSSCGDPGPGEGELADQLEVRAEFPVGTEVFDWGPVSNRLSPSTVHDEDRKLGAGSSADFKLEWRLPSGTGDIVQSDSVEIAITFSLDQNQDMGA